jgi:hypothetical protein
MRSLTIRFGLAVVVLGLLVGAAEQARASIVLEYQFTGGSFSPFNGVQMAASNVNATGSSATLQSGATIRDTAFLRNAILSTTAADAVDNNQYLQFTATPNTGYAMNLSNLTFDAAESSSSGPSGWVLRSSLDGFASNIATSQVTTPTLSEFTVGLSGAAFQNVPEATFRLYVYSPGTDTGVFFDNLTLNGTTMRTVVAAAPEPSSLAYAATGVLMLAGFAWRKRHRPGVTA